MSYADRQAALDTQYALAYREWVASLSQAERAQLEAEGIATPDTCRRTSTRSGDQLILQLTASPEANPADAIDSDQPPAQSVHSLDTSVADALASFCARIRSHPNPLLAFDAACFATGIMDVEGLSETDLAERHGVTRAAFSRLVVQWALTFGLSPSRGMRSEKARRASRKARLTFLAKQRDRAAA